MRIALVFALAVFASCCIAQPVNNYVGAPVPRWNFVSTNSQPTVPAITVGAFAIVGLNNGGIVAKNVSAASNFTNGWWAAPDFSFNVVWPITSLYYIDAATFGVVANDTIAAYSVSATSIAQAWIKVMPGLVFDIHQTNSYVPYASPIVLGPNVIIGASNLTGASNNPNSTVWAINGATGTVAWSQSVWNYNTNYQMTGSSTDQLVIVRSSPWSGSNSYLFGFNSSTGDWLNFTVSLSGYDTSYAPLFSYDNWNVYTITYNGDFRSYAVNGGAASSTSSQSCSGSSNMFQPVIKAGIVYVTCSSYIYTYFGNTSARWSSNYLSYSVTAATWGLNGMDIVFGDYYGNIYTWFYANQSVVSFFNAPGYSTTIQGLTWVGTTLVATAGSYGYSTSYGRIYAIDMISYTLSWTYADDNFNPIGWAATAWAGKDVVVLTANQAYDTYTGSVYTYKGLEGILFNSSGGFARALASGYYGRNGGIYLNESIGLLFVWDTYYYIMGYNSTTGNLLFQSSSNCAISASNGIVQIGDNICWADYSGDQVRCFPWKTAIGSTSAQSCQTTSKTIYTYDRVYSNGDGNLYVSLYSDGSVSKINPTSGSVLVRYVNKYSTSSTDSYTLGAAFSGKSVFVVQYYTIGQFDTTLSVSPAVAGWTFSGYPTAGSLTTVHFNTNPVVSGDNVYVVGYSSGLTTSIADTLYCFGQTLGISCGKTQLQQSSSTYLLAANNAIYVFAYYNFTAVQLNGGSVYYTSRINTSDSISTYGYAKPMVAANGFLGITSSYGVYVYNGWTGVGLWNSTGGQGSGPTMWSQNAVWWTSTSGFQASNPYTGSPLATWNQASGYSTIYSYTLGNGTLYGVQGYNVFRTGIPSTVNVSGGLPGSFAAAPETLLELLEKNKLWIIGIVAAIVVLAVIVVIANKNRGSTGSKEQDYVSMNNQGGRV